VTFSKGWQWTTATVLSVVALTSLTFTARAQDSFEVQVYESETVAPGKWDIEWHSIFISSGAALAEWQVVPTSRQFHSALEVTGGITDEVELGAYVLGALHPDGLFECAGARIRPRVRAPEEWGLPVGLSLSLEFGWNRPRYDPSPRTLEVRPIIDKRFGRWKVVLNPILGFGFGGEAESGSPDFGPEAKISYDLFPESLSLELEYFSGLGPIDDVFPPSRQAHLLYPKVNVECSPIVSLNAGVGFGLTSFSDRLVFAVRLGVLL
jgi:hypothetical protein